MERGLILLVFAVLVFVAPAVRATAHLSFANNTAVSINRTGCGVTKLCVETPDDCDPAGNSPCLFTSVTAGTHTSRNGTELIVQLSGNSTRESTGYIAMGLTANASEGTTMLYVCAQDNGTFFFRTMTRNNTDKMLTPNERRVTEIRGKVQGEAIQCEFNIQGTNAANTTYVILLGYGSANGTDLGPFMVQFNTSRLNVTNPAGNVTSATSGARGTSTTHAVLLLLGVLTLFVLKTA